MDTLSTKCKKKNNKIVLLLCIFLIFIMINISYARNDSKAIFNEEILSYSGKISGSTVNNLINRIQEINESRDLYLKDNGIQLIFENEDLKEDSIRISDNYYVSVHIDNTYNIVDTVNIFSRDSYKEYLYSICGNYNIKGDKVNELLSLVKQDISMFYFNDNLIEKSDYIISFNLINEDEQYGLSVDMPEDSVVNIKINGIISDRFLFRCLYNNESRIFLEKYFGNIKLYYHNALINDESSELINKKFLKGMYPSFNVLLRRNSVDEIEAITVLDFDKDFCLNLIKVLAILEAISLIILLICLKMKRKTIDIIVLIIIIIILLIQFYFYYLWQSILIITI